MNEVLQSAAIAFVAPAAVALAAAWLAGKLIPDSAARFRGAAAFAAACCAGSLLIRPWSDLIPTRHFHWPFYLALAGALAGPLAAANKSTRGFSCWWMLPAVILAALVLVPTYQALWPSRWVQVPLLAVYLLVLAFGLQALARRVSAPLFMGLCSLSAVVVAALTGALVSLSFGVSALVAPGALAGLCLAVWLRPQPDAAPGVALCYALVVGGWAYIGARQSNPWMWGALLAALAPLSMWVTVAGPLAKTTGIWKTVSQCAAVAAVLIAAVAWAVFA